MARSDWFTKRIPGSVDSIGNPPKFVPAHLPANVKVSLRDQRLTEFRIGDFEASDWVNQLDLAVLG